MQMSVKKKQEIWPKFFTLGRKYKSMVEASNVRALKSFTSIHSLPRVLSTTGSPHITLFLFFMKSSVK